MQEKVREAAGVRHLTVVRGRIEENPDDWQLALDGPGTSDSYIWPRLMAFVLDMSNIGAWVLGSFQPSRTSFAKP